MTTTMPFVCSICEELSTRICVRCTKDTCANHICEKCFRCSDCCDCEVRLEEPEFESLAGPREPEPQPHPHPMPDPDPAPEPEPVPDGIQSSEVTVEASRVIDAPVDRVWAQVEDFNNVAAWHPDVTDSHLEDGGDVRVITLRSGTVLRERLLAIDPSMHRYTYSLLDGQLPLKNHISRVTMEALDPQQTNVTWTATFEPAGVRAEVLAESIRAGVLELGLEGLAGRVGQAG